MRLIDADLLEPDAEYDDGKFWAYSKRQIEEAPSAQPEDKCGECDAWNQYKNYPRRSQWIPVSEGLPKKPFKCLLTIHTDCGDYGIGDGVCPVAHVWNGRTWNNCNGDPIGLACFEEITAWMPLPEPYQEGEQDG